MLKRIITGIVAVALFIPICISSHFQGWNVIFPIAISILSAIGVFEMSKCLGYHKNLALTIPFYILALALPMFKWYFGTPNRTLLAVSLIAIFGLLIYVLAFAMFKNAKEGNDEKTSNILTFFALNVYVIGCFTSIYMLRTTRNGAYLYLLAFLGAWLSDTFAYFTGVFLGKHKLIPRISPKKTIEGSIGGILFTIGGFVLYGVIINNAFSVSFNYLALCLCGLILAIVSQIGDLIASLIKRQYGIKDYGFVFPGHGGVLDRFDSVMLTAPVMFLLSFIL